MQPEPVLTGEVLGRRIVLHLDERVGHGGHADRAQTFGEKMSEHGSSFQW
jgi:hypothetical protein